ncbi:MAG: hypothetical protein R3C11_12250 [Planctomycetaceae bacterium]
MKNIRPRLLLSFWVLFSSAALSLTLQAIAGEQPFFSLEQRQTPEVLFAQAAPDVANQIQITPAPAAAAEVQSGINEQQELIEKLEFAIDAFQTSSYANGLEEVQSILELDTDLLLKKDRFPKFQHVEPLSLKNIALELLNDLPEEAARLYDLNYGKTAEGLYQEILKQQNPRQAMDQLKKLVARYLHTASGKKAALQLANLHFDRFEFPAAINLYSRLLSLDSLPAEASTIQFRLAWAYLESGEETIARQLLEQLKKSSPQARVTFRGETIPAPELTPELLTSIRSTSFDAQAVPHKNWAHNRGDLSRNRLSTALPAGEVSWKVDLLESAFATRPSQIKPARQIIQHLIRDTESQEQELLTDSKPLKVGSLIITRTLSGLEARDIETGKLAWKHVQPDLRI